MLNFGGVCFQISWVYGKNGEGWLNHNIILPGIVERCWNILHDHVLLQWWSLAIIEWCFRVPFYIKVQSRRMLKSPQQKVRRWLAFSQCSDDCQRYARCLLNGSTGKGNTPLKRRICPTQEWCVRTKNKSLELKCFFWGYGNRNLGRVHL